MDASTDLEPELARGLVVEEQLQAPVEPDIEDALLLAPHAELALLVVQLLLQMNECAQVTHRS